MSYQLKTLVVVLILAHLSFWLVQKVIPQEFVGKQEIKNVKIAWSLITAAEFLSSNFYIFALVTFCALLWLRGKADPAFTFAALLLACPGFEVAITGLGPINTFLSLNYYRILIWCTLLPLLFNAPVRQMRPFGSFFADYLVIALGVVFFILQLQVDTFTSSLRSAVYFFTETYLPYWVMSRYSQSPFAIAKVVCGFVLAGATVSLMGFFEFAKGWLLYDSVDEALGVYLVDGFLIRGGLGWLRASVSTGHSLALGYVLALSIILSFSLLKKRVGPSFAFEIDRYWLALLACLLAGLFASLARGMWVGCLAGVVVWIVVNPSSTKLLLKLAFGLLAVLALASLTPSGESVVQSLPFIGSSEQDNVLYRQKLFTISMMVIQENIWFGTQNFMAHPLMQLLIQGQGIIDLVNTYIGYALSSGVVGLSCFAGLFLAAIIPLGLALMRQKDVDSVLLRSARSIFSGLLAIMVMIATTSSIYAIPLIYWSLIGLAVGSISLLTSKAADVVINRPSYPREGLV